MSCLITDVARFDNTYSYFRSKKIHLDYLYINSVLLISKYYIYSCKFKKVVPSFSGVMSLLRHLETPDLQLLIYFKPDVIYYVAITDEVQNGLLSLSTKSMQFSFN
jgi:hypothetical protein